jgi:hypothetical protein
MRATYATNTVKALTQMLVNEECMRYIAGISMGRKVSDEHSCM